MRSGLLMTSVSEYVLTMCQEFKAVSIKVNLSPAGQRLSILPIAFTVLIHS